MPTNVTMPQMGESVAEGTVVRWIKKVGEAVDRDEPLFEISTDKVDAEIPAPAAGLLLEIRIGEGQTVPVNTVVGMIGASDEAPAAAAAAPAAAPAHPAQTEAAPSAPVAPPAVAKPRDRQSPEELRRLRSSPVVRRIAAEHGVDITALPGTGISGRVTKKDILDHIEQGGAAPTSPPPPTTPPFAAAPVATGGTGGLSLPDLRIPAFVEGEPVAIEPMSVMRRKIADHMVYSQTVAAHVTSFFDVDFEAVARERRALKASFAEKGVHLTYMPFIIRAIVDASNKSALYST